MKQGMTHATNSTNLADLLERVLDKGVVIAGDIKIKLVEIELLTIQIRLVVCSVERAIQMGMDWWQRDPNLSSLAATPPPVLPSRQTDPSAGQLFDERIPGARSAAAPVDPTERRLRNMEEALLRMEAQLQARNRNDPDPTR